MDVALEAAGAENGIAVEEGVDAFTEAKTDVGEVVEAVDPDELGEGSGPARRCEGEAEEDDSDIEEILDAVDAHVEAALHRFEVDSADGEPVEDGSVLAEQGPGQKVAVQPAIVGASEKWNDVPRAAVRASEGNFSHIRREKGRGWRFHLLQVALVKLLPVLLGLAQLGVVLALVFIGGGTRSGWLAGRWGRGDLGGCRPEQQPKEQLPLHCNC